MRQNTFSNLGIDIKEVKTIEDALKVGGLDYKVSKQPIFLSNGTEIHGFKSTVRDDDHVYGIVSDKYNVVQNKDGFGFIDYLKDDITFEKIGETSSGMVYLIASLMPIKILDDEFKPYLIFRNSHNGKFQLQTTICPLRIVCQNQFNIAFRESPNTITIRHSSLAEVRLKEAFQVLKGTTDYMKQLNIQAEKWAVKKVSNSEIEKVIDELFPFEKDMKDFKFLRIENARNQFLKAYQTNDNRNFQNTMWGLINAYSDYITHKEPDRKTDTAEENRFVSVTFDPKLMTDFIRIVNSKISV